DQPQSPLSLSHKKTDILCYGDKLGAIDLSVTGGSADYTYLWSNGATTEDLNDLAAGIYNVLVTDQSGCIKRDTIEITQPAAALSAKASIKDLDCYGVATGGIDLSVTGGTPGYSFNWSNGATTEDLSDISAGVYNVTITDANQCILRDTFEVKQPQEPLGTSIKQVDVLCYGDSTGSVDLTVTGGTSPYSYLWSNGANTEDLSNVKAGVYSVLVTDDNGCTKKDTIEVSQPKSALSVGAKITDVLCKADKTGAIDITVSGGTPSYQFSWSSGEETEDISGKSAGVYSVLITDANKCIVRDTFEIEEPADKLAVSGQVTDLKCYKDNSGSIDITVSGGTVTYAYAWSNGAVSEDLSGIASGTYTVTVTDKNGCSVEESFVVNQPDPVIANADDKKVCAGVAVDLTASPSGGVWSGSGVTGSSFLKEVAGVYPVYYVYTNGNGCIGIDTAYVTVERCGQAFCTYTQGYYGNAGGKSCAEGLTYSTKGLMQLALSKGSIVLGNPSLNKTFTINYNAVDTVIAMLPGGGTPTALAYTGNRTPSKLPPAMLKNGRINNVLLSQTIALAFNIRINSELDSFKVRADKFLMTQDKVSCASKDLKECSYHSYKFSSKVVNALAGNKTIADLLKLANSALAGSLPAGLSYSDVAGAVDLVNNAFDGCRVGWYADTVVYCSVASVSSSSSNMQAAEIASGMVVNEMMKQPVVKAYPNPFINEVRFAIEAQEQMQCNLVLYSSDGKVIAKLFDGQIEGGSIKTIQYNVPTMYRGVIHYVLSYNGKQVTGKIIRN
ncbi:MAG: SprB repeat-containing protein, partial [Bacteroidota bacterium]